MVQEISSKEPQSQLLLYALAKNPGKEDVLLGIKAQPVRWLPILSFGAFVSDIDLEQIRPQRVYLEDYHRVISSLLSRTSILPMTFGSIVADQEVLTGRLSQLEASIFDKLQYVEDSVEMSLKLTIPHLSIYEFIATKDKEIDKVRNFYRDHPEQLSQEVRIEVGSKIEKSLIQFRKITQESLSQVMSGVVKDMKVSPGRSQHELIDVSFLVKKSQQDDFAAKIQEFATTLPDTDGMTLVMTGPTAPYNFVGLQSA